MAKASDVHVVSLIKLLATVIVVALKFSQTFAVAENTGYCARPGDQLTFECTTVVVGATIWHGSAFDCSMNQPPNEIILAHSRYFSGLIARGNCNNGNILAQSVGVNAVNITYYLTSELNVTVSSNMHNETIQCDVEDDDGTRMTISVFRILLTTEAFGEGEALDKLILLTCWVCFMNFYSY